MGLFRGGIILLFLSQFWVLASATLVLGYQWYFVAGLMGLLAYLKPLTSIYLLLVVMVAFGSRPPDIQTAYLVTLIAIVLLGCFSHLLFRNPFLLKRFIVKLRSYNLVVLFISFYLIVSFLGLLGLPLIDVVRHSIYTDHWYALNELVLVGETSFFYSFQSVVYLFQAILIAVFVYGITSYANQLKVFQNILLSIILGWIFFVVLGYFEYFKLLNLNWLNVAFYPEGKYFSSFFTDPSWASEYLTITLPILPVLLLLRDHNFWMVSLLVILVIAGEVALILSMEGSAWLTYPFSLLMIWLTIHYVISKNKHKDIKIIPFIRERWVRIFVTIPVTLAISALLVYSIKDHSGRFVAGSAMENVASISTRAKEVIRNTDRLDYWPVAIKLFSENPIYGGGGDSFGWQYKEYFKELDGKYYNDPGNQLQVGGFSTAHNLYLQTLTGKGFLGLLFLLGFMFTLFYKLVFKKFLARNILSVDESILILVVFGSLVASLIYANVQDIFYTQPVAIIFWLIVFMGASLVHNYRTSNETQTDFMHIFKYVSIFLLLLVPFHILNISYVNDTLVAYLQLLFPVLGESALHWLLFGVIWSSALALAVSYWLHHQVIFHAHHTGHLIDDHEGDKTHIFHDTATPRAGGIGLFFSNAFLIFNPLGWLFIIAALPAFIAGIMDDFSSLTPRMRLVFQFISAALATWLLQAIVISFGFSLAMPWVLSYVISVFAIVGMINAINIIDGFNGLAGGVVLMIMISLGYVSWQVNDMVLLEVIVINSAALIGFLTVNFPKGKIFLGDGGAYFLGFMSITLTLILAQKHQQISQWYVLALVIYPVFEVLFSIYRRKMIKNMKTTAPDRIHLHQLIFKRITHNNPGTSIYLWIRIIPFTLFASFFYDNDMALILMCILFMFAYVGLYQRIVRFQGSRSLFSGEKL